MKNIKYLLMTTILLGNVIVAPIVSATEEVPNNKVVKKTDEKLEKATSGSVVDRYQAMSELDSNTNQETVTSSTETSTENSTTLSTPQNSSENKGVSTSEESSKKETTTETENKTVENSTGKSTEETPTNSGNLNVGVLNDQSLNWTTVDKGNYVLLTKYNGTDTNLVVPNEVNGKPTKLKDIDSIVIPNLSKLTSFTVEKNKKGQKVGLETTSLVDAFRSGNLLKTINLSGLDTHNVTDIGQMFYDCSNLTSLDLSNFDTSNVMSMYGMFYGCSNLTSLDLSSFDTSNVINKNMELMFYYCTNLTSLNVSNFDTSKITSMYAMFYGCSNLTSLDLSSFDTSNVTGMNSTFYFCSNLTSLDLSNFDTSKVTSMYAMFDGCNNLTSLDLSNFDTSKVTSLEFTFRNFSNNGTVVIAKDSKILSYNFKSNAIVPLVTPLLNANGGQFKDQTNTKQYFTKVAYTPEDFEKLNKITTFEQFKKDNIPTMEGKKFQNWKLIAGNDSGAQNVYPNLYGVKYQAQYKTIENSVTIVKYLSKDTGKELTAAKTIEGEIGSSYDATTSEYKIDIEGYVLDKSCLPENATGIFTKEPQVVIYYYKKLDINIPSQDVDNQKPQQLSSYGIAYTPSKFICSPTKLKDSGSQTIDFNKENSFHIGVRDLRNTDGGWQLSAQLEWRGKELPGAEILTTNQNGTIKKNINNGINGFDEVKDLVECPSSEAIGEANVVIRSDSSKPIMIGKKVNHNSVYDYDLGTVSLRIPETKYIEAGTYKGVVNWNLSNTP